MMTTFPSDVDVIQQFTGSNGFIPSTHVGSQRNTYKALSIRQCITEINGSTAISGQLASGLCLEDVKSISIIPKVEGSTASLLAEGLSTQLGLAASVLRVDQKLDQEIDSALATFYENLKSSAI